MDPEAWALSKEKAWAGKGGSNRKGGGEQEGHTLYTCKQMLVPVWDLMLRSQTSSLSHLPLRGYQDGRGDPTGKHWVGSKRQNHVLMPPKVRWLRKGSLGRWTHRPPPTSGPARTRGAAWGSLPEHARLPDNNSGPHFFPAIQKAINPQPQTIFKTHLVT